MKVLQKDYAVGLCIDDDATGGALAITDSSAQYTLPEANGWYIISSTVDAYLLGGSDPTATASAAGFSILVPTDQVFGPVRLKGPKVAYIGTEAGKICFMQLKTEAGI